MRHLAFVMLTLALLLAGCGDGGDDGDDATVTPSPTEPATDEPSAPSGEAADDSPPGDEGEWVRCEDEEGFALEHPASWHTQSADGSEGCSQLHPGPVDVPGATDERTSAITAFIDSVPFHEAAAPDPDRDADRAVTTIDGFQAVRLEFEADDEALHPAGTPITLYAVDLSPGVDEGPGTLFLDTLGLEPFDYETNRVMLDRIARSVEVTHPDVPSAPDVVARYEGGGGGFSVEGSVADDEACLRIPPHGEEVCTAVPSPEQVLTLQLIDLEPLLAGVTGDDVFRVTAERRDGVPVSFLPAPIDDTTVRGFAYTFDLDEVQRLIAYDIHGAELAVIAPDG